MRYRMELISDAVFGSGESVPGGEDIAVLCDEYGFPYMKGSTFRGIFREEMENYLSWTGRQNAADYIHTLFGVSGYSEEKEVEVIDEANYTRRMYFSNVELSSPTKDAIIDSAVDIYSKEGGTLTQENRHIYKDRILNGLTYSRMFTQLDENGMVKDGSLRSCRCIKKGLCFFGEILCHKEDEEEVKAVLRYIKWVGTMRTRGFGKVHIEVI